MGLIWGRVPCRGGGGCNTISYIVYIHIYIYLYLQTSGYFCAAPKRGANPQTRRKASNEAEFLNEADSYINISNISVLIISEPFWLLYFDLNIVHLCLCPKHMLLYASIRYFTAFGSGRCSFEAGLTLDKVCIFWNRTPEAIWHQFNVWPLL